MKKKIYLYRITDAHGDRRVFVFNDVDKISLFKNATHLADRYGMTLEKGEMEIEIPDEAFTFKPLTNKHDQ